MEPTTRVFVPTRGRVWWETALAVMPHDPVFVAESNLGAVNVRNMIVRKARELGCEIVVMVDDDVIPAPSTIQAIVTAANREGTIVAAACPVIRNRTTVFPNLFFSHPERGLVYDQEFLQGAIALATSEGLISVDAVGFGCVAIPMAVFDAVGEFKYRVDDDRVAVTGEDVDYCLRATDAGFEILCDVNAGCEHVLTVHGNGVMWAYMQSTLEEGDDEG